MLDELLKRGGFVFSGSDAEGINLPWPARECAIRIERAGRGWRASMVPPLPGGDVVWPTADEVIGWLIELPDPLPRARGGVHYHVSTPATVNRNGTGGTAWTLLSDAVAELQRFAPHIPRDLLTRHAEAAFGTGSAVVVKQRLTGAHLAYLVRCGLPCP